MRIRLHAALSPILLGLMTGCSSSSGGPPAAASQAALIALRTCSEVDDAVRAAATRAMDGLVDAQLEDALGSLEQGECWMYSGWGLEEDGAVNSAPASGAVPSADSGGSAGPTEVSETNNQVAGVDEADFIKNDADGMIYVLADGALQILDAWPPESMKLVARVPLEDQPKRLFVEGDRLVVFSSVPKASEETRDYQPWYYQSSSECTYGYDCDFTGDGQKTRLSLYDITDRAAPTLVRTIETSATFISARRVGSAVHTVLYEEPELLRTLPILPEAIENEGLCTGTITSGTEPNTYESPAPADDDAARVERLFEALREDNRAAIAEAPIEKLLGTTEDRLEDGTTRGRDLKTCSGFYDSPLADGTAYLTLMSFDLQSDDAVQTSTIISRAGASYASGSAYFISVRQQPVGGYWYYDASDVEEASTVHQFDLEGPSNRYAASGVVKGRVLNQFSMDEYEDHLRIATTTGHVPSPDVHSTLSVLEQKGDALEVVGQVDQIAPTEDIRSVRFLGDKGYVVTFKKTDPLFVFDLSNPKHPAAVGELKIPGFSTYMHPLEDGYLLSIGYDAEDAGERAYFQGLLLQIFDVRDSKNPSLVHRQVIGTRGSTSEAATNHLAFNYFAPKGMLAIPITVCEQSSGGSDYADVMTFSGVQVYRVSAKDGFTLQGQVSHPYVDPVDSATYYVGGECSNWWTDSNSVVQRTLFMDDIVYSVSDERIKANSLDALSEDLADVSLVQAADTSS